MSFEIKGGKELLMKLRGFPAEVQQKMMRAALSAGAKVIAEDAQQKARAATKGSGILADAIIVKRPRIVNGNVRAGVDVRSQTHGVVQKSKRTGKVRGVKYNPKRVWHLLEEGTAERVQKKTGRKTGKMLARHIFQRALDEKSQEAIDAAADRLRKRIAKGK